MATNIILIPDIFYYDWDDPKGGQAWLCVRPMVLAENVTDAKGLGDLVAFTNWATGSAKSFNDDGSPRFAYLDSWQAKLTSSQCTDGLTLLPVNLPTDVDLEVTVGRKHLPGQAVTIGRTDQCRVFKDVIGAAKTPAPRAPGQTPSPFVKLFNEEVAGQLNTADATDKAKQVFAFMQRMEAGKNISWKPGDVQNPYPIDVLDFSDSAGVHSTSLYWFLGLMFPLGTQDHLADLQSIDRIDIRLLANGQQVGELHIPRLDQGVTDADAYFSQIGVNFSRTLDSDIVSHEAVTYAAPGLVNLQAPSDKDLDRTLWRLPSQGARQGQINPADVTPPNIARGGLARLAAIQMRARPKGETPQPLPPGATGQLTLTPGVEISGKLEPYRRFPTVLSRSATDRKLCTVLLFTPDASCASLLDAIWQLESKQQIAEGTLSSAFSTAAIASWNLTLLHAGRLPWDGPQVRYKVLATPKSDTDFASPGQPATWPGGKISLFIPAIAAGLTATSDDQSLLWQALPGDGDAAKVQNFWKSQSRGDGWLGIPINCISIARAGAPLGDVDKISIGALWLDDFSFHAAESTIHLEKVLVLNTSAVNCNGTLTDNNNPARDYEDDLVNYNTAHVRLAGSSADVDPSFVFRPQRTRIPGATVLGGLTRQQTIPLTHGWPREPRDEPDRETQPAVGWRDIRTFMGQQYALSSYPDPDLGPYVSEVEHTYGAVLPIQTPDKSPKTFFRSRQIESPVWLPTFAEHMEQSSPFVTWRYQKDATRDVPAHSIVLSFNFAFLTPPDTPGKDASPDALNAFTVACSAWRSLAELASAASISLEIAPAVYDLSRVVEDGAEKLAKNGFPGDWSREVLVKTPIPLPDGAGVILRNWAIQMFGGDANVIDPHAQSIVALPAGAAFDDLGSLGDLVQLKLGISRPQATAPAPAASQVLVPICQQPGDFRSDQKSLRGVWAHLGFGPLADPLTSSNTGVLGPALAESHGKWTDKRTVDSASVTPAAAPNAATATAESALISALEGTDWIPTNDKTTPDSTVQVEPVLLPLGFAPCVPDSNLGVVTQTALQELAAALRDTIYLAFTSWVTAVPGTAGAALCKDRFASIAALAQSSGDGDWTGKLATFTRLLTTQLLFPQPKDHPANDSRVTGLATDVRNGTGDLKWASTAVQRMLLSDPALFKDTKALLLTSMRFHQPSGGARTPTTALARARFHRQLAGAGAPPGSPAQLATVVLGAEDLILAKGSPAAAGVDQNLAFLESLDEVRYANEFVIPKHETLPDGSLSDYSAETYRGMVDPTAPGANGWATTPIVVPLAAENSKASGRTVHLASRDLLGAPMGQWAGLASKRLEQTWTSDGPWVLADLKNGYPDPLSGAPPEPPAPADLHTIASTPAIISDLGVDQALAFAVYTVRGDEDVTVLESLVNDSFLVTIRPPGGSANPPPAPAADLAQQQLRTLLFTARGSADAADAVSKFVLANDDFEASMTKMIGRAKAAPPNPASAALIRVIPDGHLDIASGTSPDAMRLLGAKLLAPPLPPGGKPNPVAYLLVAFRVDVWAPVEMVLSQARNFPGDGWPNADPDRPRFSDEFWQVAPQSSPATRLEITRTIANKPEDWRAGHVVNLPASDWRGKEVALKRLTQKLLFSSGVGVGDHDGSTALLATGTNITPVGRTFRVAVFHEQFDEDVALGVPTAGRFPLSDRKYDNLETSETWFPEEYSKFSIDFQWLADSGLPLLRIERIFVDFP